MNIKAQTEVKQDLRMNCEVKWNLNGLGCIN